MGLLDGDILGSVLRGAASLVYGSGTLYETTLSDNGDGSYVPVVTTYPVQAMENVLSEQARGALGYTAKQLQFFILQDPGVPTPNTDCKVVSRGSVYAIVDRVESDPARSHWICKCERSQLTAAEVAAS